LGKPLGFVDLRAGGEKMNDRTLIGRAILAIATVTAFLAVSATDARAHEEPYSHLDIRIEADRVHGRVMAHMMDLAHEGGVEKPERLLDPEYAKANLETLHRVLDSHVRIEIDGQPTHPVWQSFAPIAKRRSLAFEWTLPISEPIGKVEAFGPLFPYDPPHETYLNIYENNAIRLQDLLDKTKHNAVYYSGSTQGRIEVVREFVVQGIHHIFIGPDHILFIVGLLLPGGDIGRLLQIVTAFTLAHSLTLALATFKTVNISPALVEPAIALSIVLVGLETFYAQLRRRRDRRVLLAFAFGLVHGFGFASVLADFGLPQGALGWSLAAFNLGVEIGQACIVLLVAPSLMALGSRHPLQAQRVVYLGTAFIVAAGGYWFVERAFAT
jgi:hydrogenase/urease accessory protein HupE